MASAERKTIRVERQGETVWLWLNRPQVHNAFNAVMIRELAEEFESARQEESVRVAVLSGVGESFCAGADLNWMREIIRFSFEQNLKESRDLAALLRAIYSLPKPTIARVNGAAIGGGNGLFSACDVAIASDKARFGLSEVKIGLVPAAISPYIVKRIGESEARSLFLTGERISASQALSLGLVNKVVPHDRLDAEVDGLVRLLLSSGPAAIAKSKELLQRVPGMSLEEAGEYTAEMIARLRISPEGQEGMAAFLEKRKPRWTKE